MGLFTSNSTSNYPWENLDSSEKLNVLHEASNEKAIIIFKHSTRCSISAMALNNFQSNAKLPENGRCVLLDLLSYRSISNELAEKYGVQHESPQVLVIDKGECVYHASHHQIDIDRVNQFI